MRLNEVTKNENSRFSSHISPPSGTSHPEEKD